MTAPEPVKAPQGSRNFADLGPRVLSAAVLGAVSIGLTIWSPASFAVLVSVLAAGMCWEWGRVVRGNDGDIVLAAHLVGAVTAALLAAAGLVVLALVALGIATVVTFALAGRERKLHSALGVLFVGLPSVALIWLRGDGALGLTAVLYALVVAFTTDTAAFFAGRTFGGPKLWPRVSPNKTWSGFLVGVGCAALAGFLFARYTQIGDPMRLGLLGLGLGVISQGGDLLESGLKRHFGVKDASGLIPGHGGVMDRMDSISAVAVAAAVLAALIAPGSPARALLTGG